MYNMDFVDNGTNAADIFLGINAASDGLFSSAILIIMWFIVFLASKKILSTSKAFTGSSAITLIISFALWSAQMIPDYIIIIPLIMTIMGVLYVISTGGE
jgi:hypothetical protein